MCRMCLNNNDANEVCEDCISSPNTGIAFSALHVNDNTVTYK